MNCLLPEVCSALCKLLKESVRRQNAGPAVKRSRTVSPSAPLAAKCSRRDSRKLHPDVHARASQQEQEWSLSQASLLNDAYRTLKNPLERTKYLLKLEGVQFEDERGPANTNPSKVPADLLEEVFELNMQLEELRQNQKLGEDDPQLRRDLEGAKDQFVAQLNLLDEQVRSLWSAWDAAWEQSDETKKTAAKEAMTALLQRRSYLQNLVRDVSETLKES